MKKNVSVLVCFFLSFLVVTCAVKKHPITPKPSPVKFPLSQDEFRIEEMHSRVFKQLGGYGGPEACYACHQILSNGERLASLMLAGAKVGGDMEKRSLQLCHYQEIAHVLPAVSQYCTGKRGLDMQ